MASFPVVNGVTVVMPKPEEYGDYEIDFENPLQQYVLHHYLIFGLLGSLAVVCLTQRLYTKQFLAGGLQIDDVLITLAWSKIASFAMQSIQTWSISIGGLGHHAWEMPIEVFEKHMLVCPKHSDSLSLQPPRKVLMFAATQSSYIVAPIFITCNGLSKTSLLTLYLRISPLKVFKIVTWACIAMVVSYTITIAGLLLFGCRPIRSAWDPYVSGKCVDLPSLYIAIAVANIVSDCVLFVIPIPTIVKLKMPLAQKIGAGIMFGVGSVTVATSIVRMVYLPSLLGSLDIPWVAAPANVWSFVEVNLFIICGSMPTFRKFLKRFATKLMGSYGTSATGKSNTYDKQGSNLHNRRRTAGYAQFDGIEMMTQDGDKREDGRAGISITSVSMNGPHRDDPAGAHDNSSEEGTDNTFREFPEDLQRLVAKQLPKHKVESIVYPKYETTGELDVATDKFVEWLKEQVIDTRKKHFENPWPPRDRNVGVVLVAHSMGGFVAADALFATLNDRASKSEEVEPFPLIQGILSFDTPFNGLARSMFVYGAFSNYQKVSGVFNAMTALSAAAPASLARLGKRSTPVPSAPSSSSNPAWTTWQLVAVRTGTVGAIAAGGVAAYTHREAIMQGVKSIRNLNKDSVKEGYQQGMESLGQGLAYINRGNVGKSFAWLSDHFTFVGALMKQKELNRRLDRLAAIKGVGIHDFYCSLGENGYWSGGYFVPERTFCAVPEDDHPAHRLFTRRVNRTAEDEVQAHMTMFRPEKHKGYEEMSEQAADLVCEWFLSDAPIVDDPSLRESEPEEIAENKKVDEVLEKAEDEAASEKEKTTESDEKNKGGLPDESPIDIAAAAALVPLPGDGQGDLVNDANDLSTEEKRTYMQHLFSVAEQAGTGVKGWWPTSVPDVSSNLPKLPNMPSVSSAVSSLGQSVPSVSLFKSKKKDTEQDAGADKAASETTAAAEPQVDSQATEKSEGQVQEGSENQATDSKGN
ncbi:hypothetical protein HJFPF1_07301 [Paramyrothecium foliicola]|nr:hypothetical protein HJFPF1_07301 [Paramyrothecium foliicola]